MEYILSVAKQKEKIQFLLPVIEGFFINHVFKEEMQIEC